MGSFFLRRLDLLVVLVLWTNVLSCSICDRLAGLTDGFDDVLRMLPQQENDDTDNFANMKISGDKKFKKRKVL